MLSKEDMDLWVWTCGFNAWVNKPYLKKSRRPHELDYLRGLHNTNSLRVLARWLSSSVQGDVRITTMWQDKHVYVKPYGGGRRELADIAIIKRSLTSSNQISRSMWVLQAKVVDSPTDKFKGPSSKKEIELFEGPPGFSSPQFELLDGAGSNVIASFPAGAFKGPKHWSFLTIHRNPSQPVQCALRDRWPGSLASVAHQSFCGSLIDVVNGSRGAPVSLNAAPSCDWSRLYLNLMHGQFMKATKHAASPLNPFGNIMQFSTLAMGEFFASSERRNFNASYNSMRSHGSISMRSSLRMNEMLSDGMRFLDEKVNDDLFGGSRPPGDSAYLHEVENGGDPGGFPLTIIMDVVQ